MKNSEGVLVKSGSDLVKSGGVLTCIRGSYVLVLSSLFQLCFIKRNGQRRLKYLVIRRDIPYFVKHHSDSTKKFSETDIFNMLEFLIDNIFMFGGRVCSRQTAYIWWCYSRAFGSYQDFLDRGLLLRKLLNQGFLLVKLKSPPWLGTGRNEEAL